MKYQLEQKEIKNINDLVEFKNYIDSQYNKEKKELEESNQAVPGYLYGQYLDVFVRTLTNMMQEAYFDGNMADSKFMKDMSRILKIKLNQVKEKKEVKIYAYNLTKAVQKNKVYDKTFNAIMDGKLQNILDTFNEVEDLDEIISSAVEKTKEYEVNPAYTEESIQKTLDAATAKAEKRKASKAKKNDKLQKKMMHGWTNEAYDKGSQERLENLEHERKEGLLKSAHLAQKQGKTVKITNDEIETIGEQAIDFSEISTKAELDRVFSNTEIYNGSFADVRRALQHKKEYLEDISSLNDGAVLIADVKKAMSLDLYSQMVQIRNERGFFEKLFHPFQNSKEKKLLQELKNDCIANGVTEEELAEARNQDFDIQNVINNLATKSGLLENKNDIRNNIEVDELKNDSKALEANKSIDLSLNKSLDNSMNKNK